MGRRCINRVRKKRVTYITKPTYCNLFGGFITIFMFDSDNVWYSFEDAFVKYPPSSFDWVYSVPDSKLR